MGMKLHRNQRVFRRKHPVLRAVLWAIACVAVVALGFFGAGMMDKVHTAPPAAESTLLTEGTTATTPTTQPTKPAPDEPADTTPADTTLRGFYLPLSALRNGDTLPTTLKQAAKAGFTAVVFDLKDENGQLHYRFASQTAQLVNGYSADAFTAEELAQIFATIEEEGLRPIPRLYAFRDHLGAKALSAARIGLAGNPGWTWYDGDPNNGGRAWLNPYADEAHSYLIGLAQELKEMGCAAVLLDSVQFPAFTGQADFGSSSNTNLTKDKVLSLFVDKMKTALDECPVLLGCTLQSALGNDTLPYGGNPVTFAPTMVSPDIFPAALPERITIGDTVIPNSPDDLQQTVQALVAQVVLRTKVMAETERPAILPLLQTDGYSAAQIQQIIDGCTDGGCEQFILYHPQGTYDFTALTPQ